LKKRIEQEEKGKRIIETKRCQGWQVIHGAGVTNLFFEEDGRPRLQHGGILLLEVIPLLGQRLNHRFELPDSGLKMI